MSPSADAAVGEHYGRPRLGAGILAALRIAGKDPDALTLDDLTPVDHFHTRGRESTVELIRLAEIERGTRVVDVGGGIGGAARLLAREADCRVAVVDLTEEFCQVGEDLTRRVGLADRVTFHHGSALAMPFPDGMFDVAWTQHSSMNVADKPALYREIRRVVRPGGRLAMHEIMAGPTQPVHFPVPWARDPAISHLPPPDAIHQLLREVGFRELAWQDQSAISLDWFRRRAAEAAASGPPVVGLHLLLGPDSNHMLSNYVKNLEEQRVRVIMGVWERT
jgi:SAM-dependent methyltransferase